MRKLLLILAFATAVSAHAQVFVQNTMFNYSRILYNPAAAGLPQASSIPGVNVTLLGRLQWMGIEGAPQTSAIMVNSSAERLGGGIGGYILGDKLGPMSRVGASLAYSYHLKLGSDAQFGVLQIGASAGFLQQSINGNWIYDPSQGPDPILPLAPLSGTVPSLAAGLVYRGLNDKLIVGFSGQDLLEPSLENLLASSNDFESRIPRSFYFNAAYTFDLSPESHLTPSVFARTEGILPPQLDASLYWDYKSIVFGASYRFFSDSFSGILGFNVNDRTFLAYGYDYTLNALNATGDVSTHEIIISYTIPGSAGPRREYDQVKDTPNNGSL